MKVSRPLTTTSPSHIPTIPEEKDYFQATSELDRENLHFPVSEALLTAIERVCVFVYVCMYVCMCACVCMYVCMHACMHVCMYVCMHVCMYACMYVCMYICVCVYVCIYMYVCICKFVYHIAGGNI